MINAPQLSEAVTTPPAPQGEAAHPAGSNPRRGKPPAAGGLGGRALRRSARHPSAAKVCLWLGLLALSAAVVGSVVNSVLTGWMAVAGMAAIGLFYLGLSSIAAEHAPGSAIDFAEDSLSDTTGDHS
jgi:hypothetical protein